MIALTVIGAIPAHGKSLKAKSAKAKKAGAPKRKPAVNEMGMPLKADGTVDYAKVENPFKIKGWTIDAGGSRGSKGDSEYNEYGVGGNLYFYRWLAWRNVAYMRNEYGGVKHYGFDTSERFSYEFGNKSGFAVFGAPGFRWGGSAGNGPFVEGGASIRIGNVAIAGGARELFTSWTRTGASNETQIFVNLFAGAFP